MAIQHALDQNTWTYGIEIVDQQYQDFYGNDMFALISKCLAVMPRDRPTLQELRTALDNLRPPAVSEQDKTWLRRFTRAPPAPRATPVGGAFR
jgi:hypothetical protein